jgi:two-component system cell cycle sensor histidine kinase/response regulator CckA
LEAKGYAPAVAHSGRVALGHLLERPPAAALIDLRLEDMSGLELMRRVKERSPGVECIVLTGHASQSSAIKAINLGAYSYVQKPYDIEQLLVTVRRALEKRETVEALRESEEKYRALIENTLDVICSVDERTIITYISPQVARYGLDPDEMVGQAFARFVHPADWERVEADLRKAIASGQELGTTFRTSGRDGAPHWMEARGKAQHDRAGVIVGLTGVLQDITERRRGEEERAQLMAQIREQAQEMRRIIDTVPEGVLLLEAGEHGSWHVMLANPAAQQDLAILASREGNVLDPKAFPRAGQALDHLGDLALEKLLAWPAERAWHEVALQGRQFEIIARPTQSVPDPTAWVVVIRDMTHERETQQRLRQQERMAAIGQLAGGVAHDFNNILTAIQGYTEFVLGDLQPGDPMCKDLQEIEKAVARAAALTSQLLIFSRKQVVQPQVLDLNGVIANMQSMLRRLIGEDVGLSTLLSDNLGRVMADPGQIEQVVMNLVVNARDAIRQKAGARDGRIVIETDNVVLDEDYARVHPDAEPGSFTVLAVSDTGTGMDKEVRTHLFEPFFTTKEKGKGVGLGLATVYGIVKQSGGSIGVYSEPGAGTTFRVYLPWVTGQQGDATEHETDQARQGCETVLLVEDEDVVRKLARRSLERHGYTVLEAHLPSYAMHVAQEHEGPIPLLVSDVIMPEMSGRDLAELLLQVHPEMKVLYISGYTDDAIAQHGVLEPGVAFLEKPFTPAALARKVRQVLDDA